jgi:hypothetical protein
MPTRTRKTRPPIINANRNLIKTLTNEYIRIMRLKSNNNSFGSGKTQRGQLMLLSHQILPLNNRYIPTIVMTNIQSRFVNSAQRSIASSKRR